MKNIDLYKSIINHSPLGYANRKIILDDRGNPYDAEYIEVNPPFMRIMGFTENVIGKRMTEVMPNIELDNFNWIKFYGEVALNNKVEEFNQFSNILNKWFKVNVYSPQKGYFVTQLSDITREVNSEIMLNTEKEKLRITLHSIAEGVIVTDEYAKISMINDIGKKLIGKVNIPMNTHLSTIFNIGDNKSKINSQNLIKQVIYTGSTIEFPKNTLLKTIDGKNLFISGKASPIKDRNNHILGIIIVFRDITKEIEKEKEILYLSYHDNLTGLYNRAFFEEELKRLDNERNLPISIIMGDVNGLKITNDVFGHESGDKLLKSVADVLKLSCRSQDIIARWGGDEFIILLPKTSKEIGHLICERIKNNIINSDNLASFINISLGLATKDEPSKQISSIIKEAEELMYSKKLLEGKKVRNDIIEALKKSLFDRNLKTVDHINRIRFYSKNIALKLGLTKNEIDDLEMLAIFQYIGKIGVKEPILKKSEILNNDGLTEFKKFPEIGYRIAKSIPELSHIANLILSTNERWDGTGYPQRLKGEEIPLLSRILAVTSYYDSILHSNPHGKTINQIEAIREVLNNKGMKLDPNIVDVFLDILDKSPKEIENLP
ncbi:sensor domain-containing diguanylate cyclase/phosphohydrolase [Clostridium sp. Cult2]|uniref:sensor domain-containing diguanylate cyclase/phosphohydrolase n=1 Tax=Clostridium sp. Cult2 TaxID=2079003 RepID=UPI001F37D490|nr:diguanylate cyclase [Clostridium sp. Cult2]MCF6464853.1 transcriptional regulator [Clostridium sp. Cult2]